jgi:hypothetical protein
MIRRLVVQATPGRPRTPGALPAPSATVRMVDHRFRLSTPLRAGRQVLRVVNAGRVPHEFKLFRVLPGRTGAESLAWTPESGTPPPDEEVTTIATLPPGGALTTTVDLVAGEYTLFCVPQRARGMQQVVRVHPAARASRHGAGRAAVRATSGGRITRAIIAFGGELPTL